MALVGAFDMYVGFPCIINRGITIPSYFEEEAWAGFVAGVGTNDMVHNFLDGEVVFPALGFSRDMITYVLMGVSE